VDVKPVVAVMLLVMILVGCLPRSATNIQYVFHFHLNKVEMNAVPKDVAKLVNVIEMRTANVLPRADRDELFSRCPYRNRTDTGERLIWGLDGKKPEEGDRCVWIDIDLRGEITKCGLVILG